MYLNLVPLPAATALRSVTAREADFGDRRALRVELTPEAAAGQPGVDYVDEPTFVELPVDFSVGRLSVDIYSTMNGLRSDLARGFAGLAYRVRPGFFECAYVRPANGLKHSPPEPRNVRAVQYFAYPDWKFDRLREERPGRYEAGANIGLEEWISLEVTVDAVGVAVAVNGQRVLDIAALAPRSRGNVGLFVDIGTTAYFSNLIVEPR